MLLRWIHWRIKVLVAVVWVIVRSRWLMDVNHWNLFVDVRLGNCGVIAASEWDWISASPPGEDAELTYTDRNLTMKISRRMEPMAELCWIYRSSGCCCRRRTSLQLPSTHPHCPGCDTHNCNSHCSLNGPRNFPTAMLAVCSPITKRTTICRASPVPTFSHFVLRRRARKM